jgi:hypothetical protein
MSSSEENPTVQPCALHWLDVLRQAERCKWCGDARPLNKAGLCGSCRKNERDLAKAKKSLEEMSPTEHRHQAFLLGLELRWAEAKTELCRMDGEALDTILNGDDFSSHTLEEYLCAVSRRVCNGRDLFGASANLLSEAFDVDQRRLLAYMLWKMFLVGEKRNRKNRAVLFANQNRIREAEASSQ